MRAPWNVTRAFKHHVLEKMRETRAAGELVGRTYVVPQIHGHHRQAMIFGEDDVEAVLQFVFLEFELRHFERRGLGSGLLRLRSGGRLFRGLRGRLR